MLDPCMAHINGGVVSASGARTPLLASAPARTGSTFLLDNQQVHIFMIKISCTGCVIIDCLRVFGGTLAAAPPEHVKPPNMICRAIGHEQGIYHPYSTVGWIYHPNKT